MSFPGVQYGSGSQWSHWEWSIGDRENKRKSPFEVSNICYWKFEIRLKSVSDSSFCLIHCEWEVEEGRSWEGEEISFSFSLFSTEQGQITDSSIGMTHRGDTREHKKSHGNHSLSAMRFKAFFMVLLGILSLGLLLANLYGISLVSFFNRVNSSKFLIIFQFANLLTGRTTKVVERIRGEDEVIGGHSFSLYSRPHTVLSITWGSVDTMISARIY